MRVWIISCLILFLCIPFTFCKPLSGSVQKEDYVHQKKNKVIDSYNGAPVKNARVSVPTKGIETMTDGEGNFDLGVKLNKPVILSVKAQGYTPFSLTVSKKSFSKPLVIGISKQSLNEIVIDSTLHHLGDNNYSFNSANADDFIMNSSGANFSKRFFVKELKSGFDTIIKVGSIIGVDTEMARSLGQNSIRFAFSSPTKIFINSHLVGEIKINGDEQRISFPTSFLKANAENEVSIETGKNMQQYEYVDYDDIEFMNLILEVQ